MKRFLFAKSVRLALHGGAMSLREMSGAVRTQREHRTVVRNKTWRMKDSACNGNDHRFTRVRVSHSVI